jgi:hypothetical protein
MDLLAFDLLEGSLWMEVRAKQDPKRSFGPAPTAAWQAFLKATADSTAPAAAAMQFLRTHAATEFFASDPPPH